jgi:hypothetical protein
MDPLKKTPQDNGGFGEAGDGDGGGSLDGSTGCFLLINISEFVLL